MARGESKPSRRQIILESLARELEEHPGGRITTASLGRAAGVSEAALYRHFASKAKMFEAAVASCSISCWPSPTATRVSPGCSWATP